MAGRDGVLFGTTRYGGDGGNGTIYQLTPPSPGQTAWSFKLLHAFSAGFNQFVPVPTGELTADASGAIYGTTSSAPSPQPSSPGAVYRLRPPAAGQNGWTYDELYTFGGVGLAGDGPGGGVIAGRDGSLYGTTINAGSVHNCGGVGCGIAFRLTPNPGGALPWTETTLYDFTGGADGWAPNGSQVFGCDWQGHIALYGFAGYTGSKSSLTNYDYTFFKVTFDPAIGWQPRGPASDRCGCWDFRGPPHAG